MKLTLFILFSLIAVSAFADACLYRCATCDASNPCLTCENGYFLVNAKECKRCPAECSKCVIDSQGLPKCTACADGTMPTSSYNCSKCLPSCQTCSLTTSNCTSCRPGLKIQTDANGLQSCVEDNSCNSIPHCNSCLNESVTITTGQATPPANAASQICQTCSDPFYSFRRECERCPPPCLSCQFDHGGIWDQVKNFWNTSRIQLLQKVTAASSTTKRLLQNSNNNGSNQYSQNYKNWTLTEWNAAKWTSAQLKEHDNMTMADMKGWTQAYFFFKNAQTNLKPGDTLINFMYNCLPITEQLLNLTTHDNNQWQHLARFANTFANKKWNGPKLNRQIVDMAGQRTICTDCPDGFYPNGGFGCVRCPDNCVACYNQTACMTCAFGYFLSGSTCSLCSTLCGNCSGTATNCISCVSPKVLLSDNTCATCTSPCRTCTPANLAFCVICIEGYSAYPYSNGTCYTCPTTSCRQCNATNTSQCLLCRQGYLLSNNTCVSCPGNCSSCSFVNTVVTCFQCAPSYSLVNSVCTKCAEGCSSCYNGNSSICRGCKNWEYLDYKTGKCKKCKDGCSKCASEDQCENFDDGMVIFDGQTIKCRQGCRSCDPNSPEKCFICSEKFYLTSDSTCVKCAQGCQTCTNGTSCASCYGNANLINGTCVTCAKSCSACNSLNANSCTACFRGYTLSNLSCTSLCQKGCITCSSTSPTTCTQCDRGYALTTAGKCIKCVGQCSGKCNAKNITQCNSCMQGFYLKDNSCVRCAEGCASCASGICSACYDGYEFVSSTSTCSKMCLAPCATCATSSCDTCLTGYVKQNGVCVVDTSCNPNCLTCLSGSYADANLNCQRCPSRCSACTSTGCNVCFDGFYLNSSNVCVACPASCLTCYDASTCNICASGYVKEIISAGQGINTIVYGSSCIACNDNCQTCSIYPKRCTSCKTGYRLVNERCVGVYTVIYRYQLDYNHETFLNNGESENFRAAVANKANLAHQRNMLRNVKKGSTIVEGTMSADNLVQAYQIKDQISGQTQVGGYNVLYSSAEVAYNDQVVTSNTSDEDNSKRTAIIVGSVVGGVIFLLIMAAIIYYCCCRKKTADQYVEGNTPQPYNENHALPMSSSQNFETKKPNF